MNEIDKRDLFSLYHKVKEKGTFEYLHILDDFKRSEYYDFYRFLKANRQVISILKYNYSHSIKLDKLHNSTANHHRTWNDVNPKYRWRQQRAITMQLFNYLSSVFATVDFSRSNMRKYIYSNPKIAENFKISKESYFDNNPVHRFIQDLRNYTSHNSFLRISSEVIANIELGEERRNIYLLKEDLLESDRWSNLSKKFLQLQESKIYIIDIIKNHYPAFSKFQDWAYLTLFQADTEFTAKFRDELKSVLDLAERVDMSQTSLPFGQAYIRYLDKMINESRVKCLKKFEYI
ncbi:hypothetical protein POKO110462_00715 [Pontibacter korlensis]|uniref:Uncharacterized protein n=1 Tax=Pontibacter korlensis TaxID=400092 RepID=A0A0E3UVU9_9BACT|nr:hypothetical protein [Pontibacter korlensis]AKD02792.1 hypothetical protein PKOR_06220 [Pontibacter korlensis]